MKLRSLLCAGSGALVCLSLVLAAVAYSAESDLDALRAKAESGNAIAQYNVGMAYLEGRQVPKDVIEAYVWLTLAGENGATGKALKALTPTLSKDQIAAAETRLAERRSVISNHLIAQSAAGVPGAVATPRAVRTPDPTPPPAPVAGAKPAPVVPAAAPVADDGRVEALTKELAAERADNAKLSAEIISVWKELDSAKVAQVASGQRADRADAAAKQSASDISALAAERDQLRQQLAAALTAAKPASPAPRDDTQAKALAAAEEARAKAAQRADQAEAAASQRTKDIETLTTERDRLRQQLATALAAAKPASPGARDDTQAKALAAAEQARAKAAADLEAARRDLAAIQKLNKELSAQADRLAGENATLKVQMASDREVSRKLAEAQAALTRLQAENAELKARPAPALEISADDLARLKQDLARAKETVQMTVRSYTLARQEVEQFKARLATIQQAVGAAPDAAAKPVPPPAAP